MHHIFRLGSFRRGQGCFQAGDLLLDVIDHLDIPIHQRLVLFLALGQTVHQCAQLALCLEQLALLIYDQSLSLALFGQIQRSVLAFFGIFQTHFLDLVEIHKRHLSYYRPVYRGPCADVISIIAHRPLVCNERTAFFTVWCRFGNNFFAFGLNLHDNFTHRHSVPCGRLRRRRIPAACCPPAAAPAPAVPHAQSGGLSRPTAPHCGLPA